MKRDFAIFYLKNIEVLPVGVHDRQDVELEPVDDLLVGVIVFDKLLDHVHDRGGTDPLPGVDPAIDPNRLLLGIPGRVLVDVNDVERSTLPRRFRELDEGHLVRVGIVEAEQVLVHVVQAVVPVEVVRIATAT